MQVVSLINQELSKRVPVYAGAVNCAQEQYKKSLQTLNNIYSTSEGRVQKVIKTTNGFKNQAFELCSQSADDLLDYLEEKLSIQANPSELEKEKKKRAIKILQQLKRQYFESPLEKIGQYRGALVLKGKALNQKYILPLFITFKATLMVSRQIMVEMIGERLGQLKMTYNISKDSVTMFFTGQFQQEKILARVSQNISSFKNFTISFVQKGMEIKVSKKDLYENYHTVVDKLQEVIQGVSTKGVEKWEGAKTTTVNLYNSVLNRIKQKQIEITTEYSKTYTPLKVTAGAQQKSSAKTTGEEELTQ